MTELKRSLDLKDLTLFGISSILGSGGFNLVGRAVLAGGSAWPALVGGVTSLMMGSSWSYTRALQIHGGNISDTDTIRDIFGPMGEGTAATAIVFYNVISIAVIIVFVTQLLFPTATWISQVVFSTLILAAMATFSLFGIDVNKSLINGFTWLLLVVLCAAMGLGGWGALMGAPLAVGAPRNLTQSLMDFFFIIAGFDAIMKFSEEAKEPQQDLPRAFFLSNAISGILLLGIAAAIAIWAPGVRDTAENNALGHMFAHFLGPSAIGITKLLMTIFMLVTTFVVFLATTRYLFGTGSKYSSMLSWLSVVNKSKAPWVAIAVVFVIGFLGLLVNRVSTLVRGANVGIVVILGMVSLAMTAIDWSGGRMVSAAVHGATATGLAGILGAVFV